MKNITAMSLRIVHGVALLLLGIVSAVSAAMAGESSYNPPPSYYYCTSDPAAHTRYYSQMFKVPGKGVNYQQISSGFGQFLAQKYAVKSAAVCFGDPDQSKAHTGSSNKSSN